MTRGPNGASVEEKDQNHRAKPSSVVKSLATVTQGKAVEFVV